MNVAARIVLCFAVTGAVGGIGFVSGRFLSPPIVVTEFVEDAEAARQYPRDAGTAADLALARSEIEALKAELRSLRAAADEPAEEEAQAAPEQTASAARRPRFTSYKDYLEHLKAENPERYEQMMDYRRRRAEAKAEAFEARDAFLRDIDIALLPPTARRDHLVYIDTLRRYEELSRDYASAMENGERPSKEMRSALAEVSAAVHRLRHQERTVLMHAVARSAGLDAQGADELVQLVDTVYNATASHLKYSVGPSQKKDGRHKARKN